MLISILLPSLGILSAHRILRRSLQQIGLLELHARFFLISSALMILFFMLRAHHPMQLWLFIGSLLIFLSLLPKIFSFLLEKQIEKHQLRLLDQLVLAVQSGRSLRAAISALAEAERGFLHLSILNLQHAILYETSESSLRSACLKNLYGELSRIDKSNSKCADQLRSFRQQLKTLEDFRRRSGQVSLQIRMQAAISALLYAGLLVFTVTQFGFYQHRGLIAASGTLFFVGMVTVFVIGRRNRWST